MWLAQEIFVQRQAWICPDTHSAPQHPSAAQATSAQFAMAQVVVLFKYKPALTTLACPNYISTKLNLFPIQ